MTEIPIKIQLVKTLSNAKPSRIVAVKADGDAYFELWVTDKTGIPYPIKDETGGGGGGTITAIQNTDGNLEITGTTTKTINVSPSLLSLINSALQSGDNVSELSNDAGYITLADIPTFNPTDYDLEDFTNTSADPFIRTSDLGGAVDSVNGQTGVVVLDSDDISEGTTNLYFTDARALGAIPDATPTVKGIAKLYTSLGSNTDGAVDQNTVNTALALKANLQNVKQYIISKPVGNYGSVTGTTAETVLLSIPILGGVYENGDYLGFNIWTIKNGTAGITAITVRAGTTGTTADSVLALLYNHIGGQNSAASEREGVLFEDGNFINGRTRPVVNQFSTDLGSFVTYTRFALNPSNDWFLTFTATHANSADEVIVRSYQLSKTKTF